MRYRYIASRLRSLRVGNFSKFYFYKDMKTATEINILYVRTQYDPYEFL